MHNKETVSSINTNNFNMYDALAHSEILLRSIGAMITGIALIASIAVKEFIVARYTFIT